MHSKLENLTLLNILKKKWINLSPELEEDHKLKVI